MSSLWRFFDVFGLIWNLDRFISSNTTTTPNNLIILDRTRCRVKFSDDPVDRLLWALGWVAQLPYWSLDKFSVTLPPPPLSTSSFSNPTAVRIKFSDDPVDELSKHWGEGCDKLPPSPTTSLSSTPNSFGADISDDPVVLNIGVSGAAILLKPWIKNILVSARSGLRGLNSFASSSSGVIHQRSFIESHQPRVVHREASTVNCPSRVVHRVVSSVINSQVTNRESSIEKPCHDH